MIEKKLSGLQKKYIVYKSFEGIVPVFVWVCLCVIILVLTTLFILPQNKVYAEAKITTFDYYIKDNYIMKILPGTTIEDFLKSISVKNNENIEVYDNEKKLNLTECIKTGMKLKIGNSIEYTLIVRGDINSDGKMTATDLSQLKQYYIGTIDLSENEKRAADINYTYTITILDISQLRMLLVGFDILDVKTSTGNIIVTPSTQEATKEVNLIISVKEDANIEYDKILVSLDSGATYLEYKNGLKITENVNLKIKLVQNHTYENYDIKENIDESQVPGQLEDEAYEKYMERLVESGYAEKTIITEEINLEEENYLVNNIDNIAPNPFEFAVETTTNSIEITAETIDTMKDYLGNILDDGLAGVKAYEYRTSENEWQTENVFTNLTKNTEYVIYVRAIDYAGNIREATNNGLKVKTKDITIQNTNIKFEYTNTEPSNKDIVVGIKCEEIEGTDYRIQYQIKGIEEASDKNGEWIDGENVIVTENSTIYARVVDDNKQEGVGDYARLQITNIDKLPPLPFTPEIIEQTNTNIKVKVVVQDAPKNNKNMSSGIKGYKYTIITTEGEYITKEETKNEYNFIGLDLENMGYSIYVVVEDKAGNITVSETISVGKLPERGLGIGNINPGPENVTINDGAFGHFNPAIPVGFKAINTPDASWGEGGMPEGWNKGLVIEDENGNQFVWVPVDGINVKYEKGTVVWDYGDSKEWAKLTNQIAGDDLPTTLKALQVPEEAQIDKYKGFYISRYEMGNDDGVLGSKEGLKVVNGVTYEEAKTYAESMYKLQNVKSGLLTGTMWDTMTKWIANDKGQNYVTNNINAGNTYETAFTFSGEYATGPNNPSEKRSAYKTGTNINKAAKTRTLLTTGIVDKFKVKNIYDTAGNVWEYTAEYLINEYNETQYIARGGNYYWQYDKVVSAGTAVREYISKKEGEQRNEGGFRVALYLVEGTMQIGVYEDFNRTINGKEATYKNPVIPAGFAAVNKGADWGNGTTKAPDWNNGLVIEDINGNEFVWVPVDGIDVKYEKWTVSGMSYEAVSGDDIATTLTTWNETEKTQIENYGGFYIARYESSLGEKGTVESKPNKNVIVDKNYEEMKTLSESMEIKEKNKKYVGTGLITGTQWDTVMRWLANKKGEEEILRDSSSWGTFGESLSKTGVTAENNIYDLAGNAWEATAEKDGENSRVYRGGVYLEHITPVAYRGSKNMFYPDGATGFRIALYVTGEVAEKISVVPVREDAALNGTRGSLPIPDASTSVTITPSTTNWINKDIKVTLKNTNANYYLEYQINSTTGTWIRAENLQTLTIKENCKIYTRLTNTKKQGGKTNVHTVGNIDKVAPNSFTPVITNVTASSIKINANTNDNLSGIKEYKYYVDKLLVYSGSETSYVRNNLQADTEYTIYVVAVDKAGNTRTSSSVKIKTKKPVGVIYDENQTFDGGSNGTYNNPVIPKGFAAINENGAIWGTDTGYQYGLVITDAVDEDGNSIGNEFVWVPVDGELVKLQRKAWTSYSSRNWWLYSESLSSAVKTSVNKNGGFYIARYEAGKENGKAVFKKNMTVYNYVTYNSAVSIANAMYPEDDMNHNVRATVIYGAQWDATMMFIGAYDIGENGYNRYASNSTGMGNYPERQISGSGTRIKTGSVEAYRQKNIYDMAGNVSEITMEREEGRALPRGGQSGAIEGARTDCYGSAMPAGHRMLRHWI